MSNNKLYTGVRCHIIIAALLLSVLYVWRFPLLKLLLSILDNLLSDVDQSALSILLVIVGILFSIHICIEHKKYAPNMALFVYVFSLVLAYLYCRFGSESVIFWSYGYFAYLDIFLLPILFLVVVKVWQRCCKSKKIASLTEEGVGSKFQIDSPIDNSKDDILGHYTLVKNLYRDLCDMGLLETSFSVGVSAPWGKGKTSFLKLFQEKAEREGNIAIWFNARVSKKAEDIQEDFFRRFSEALAEHHIGFALLVNRYLSALGLLDGATWLTTGLHLFRTLSAVDEKKRINQAIDNIGKNIYVFVDDLDRLTGAEILEVFKIIDKNADFHRTIFMVGYDKSYVNEVLIHHLGHRTATDYTDKYFSLEMSLPEVSSESLAAFAYQYIEERITAFTHQQEITITLDMWKNVSRTIVPHLDSLRHIKRYTNLFLLRYSKVVGNVDPADFMLLTLLRYRDIEVYNALSRGRFIEPGGFSRGTNKLLYSNLSEDEARAEFNKLGVWDGAEQIIETLFPPSSNKMGNESRSISEVYRRICMADYFSLYFYDQSEEIKYHKDLLPLFSGPEEKVLGVITRLFEEGQMDRLEDFLNYKSAGEIGTLEELQRLCLLLTYFLQKDYRYNVIGILLRLFSYKHATTLIARIGRPKVEYKDALDSVLPKMIEIAPYEISSGILYPMMREPDEQYNAHECLDWILRCQNKYYDDFWGTAEWNYDRALVFGQIAQIDGEGFVPKARQVLISMMTKYPNEFAGQLFVIGEEIDKQCQISFKPSFPADKIFFGEGVSYLEWLKGVSDEKLK